LKLKIKHINTEDWPAIANIYNQGIDTGVATFETEVPTWKQWDASHIKSCRLAAWIDKQLIGWAALSAVSSRCVYGGVAEVSVYVDTDSNGKGIGSILLKNLINESEKEGLWTLQSGIFPQNIASIKLHEKLGFRKIGYREKVGKLHGIWYDNILMERRSKIIGID
jgi:phosphinothricin acetyltransferase